MSKFIWMAVTPDEYEMPVAVADSQTELAKMLDMKLDTLRKTYFNHQNGVYTEWTKYKIIKIKI